MDVGVEIMKACLPNLCEEPNCREDNEYLEESDAGEISPFLSAPSQIFSMPWLLGGI